MQIKLSKTWTVGSPLPEGVGGFGRVFDVTDSEGKPGGDARGRLEGHDRREDLDRGQFVPRTAVEMASEGLSITFAAHRLAPVPRAGRGHVPTRPTEPHAVDRGR